jgi:hypothetical protein
MTLTVLIGPKTRLGAELISQLTGEPVLAVARDATDAAVVAALPGLGPSAVVDGSTPGLSQRVQESATASGSTSVRLVLAALGPVHPEQPNTAYDAAGVTRDLGFVEEVLASGLPVQAVLISTILALAPGEDRRYYGGWKALIEQQLQQLVDDRNAAGGRCSLTVFYPGRLLDQKLRTRQLRVHSSYARLARAALATSPDQSTGRLIGMDTRIWLWVRSISFALRSLRPTSTRSGSRPPSAT